MSAAPEVVTRMCIRRSPAEVCEAFLDPAVTSQFWFSAGSERLEAGRSLTWTWSWYGLSVPVQVLAVEPGARIAITWGDPPRPVEWRFTDRGDGSTMVEIRAGGFDGDSAVADAIDAMGGFSFVLAGCKALLEHGIALQLVPDHQPDAHVTAR